MHKIILSIFILSISLPMYAVDVYFSKERSDHFARMIAQTIRQSYPHKSRRRLRLDILKILRQEINPWVDAYPIPAGISLPKYISAITTLPGLPIDRSEYYIQNAFILFGNPQMELKERIDNYFGSFIHLARKRHVDYLNKQAPKFKLRLESDLLQQLEEHLPVVANNAFPYLDKDGNPIEQHDEKIKDSKRFKLAVGNPKHKHFKEFLRETQRYNHFSTPLFLWLLQQEDFSVSPEQLFTKAMEIYENPIVALGVISWIMSGDALTVNRTTSSVVSYKVEKLVEGGDIPGYQYHFWGYLVQALIGNRIRVGLLAYIYEKLYQHDIPDWKIDVVGLRLGKQVRYYLKRPNKLR